MTLFEKALEFVRDKHIFSASEFYEYIISCGGAYSTANALLQRLKKMGIIIYYKRKGNIRYYKVVTTTNLGGSGEKPVG